MTSYTRKGRITEAHCLEVEVPAGVPAGEAEVTVVVGRGSTNSRSAAMLETLGKIHRMHPNRPRRTKDDIDAELNAMRDEWENRGQP